MQLSAFNLPPDPSEEMLKQMRNLALMMTSKRMDSCCTGIDWAAEQKLMQEEAEFQRQLASKDA
jgi:hypothetical protein